MSTFRITFNFKNGEILKIDVDTNAYTEDLTRKISVIHTDRMIFAATDGKRYSILMSEVQYFEVHEIKGE